MTNLDQVWGATSADSNSEDNVTPPAGTYVVRIADARAGVSKKGESYFAVDLKDDQQGHKWMIYKAFTKNGQPHEGSIKSAKITLRQLGLDVPSPAQLEGALKTLIGRYFAVEVVQSDKMNAATGAFYLNTDVTGPASAPTMGVGAPAQAPQVQQPQPVQVPGGATTVQFPAAVPGQPPTVVQQPQAPAAAMQQQVQQAAAAMQGDNNPGW